MRITTNDPRVAVRRTSTRLIQATGEFAPCRGFLELVPAVSAPLNMPLHRETYESVAYHQLGSEDLPRSAGIEIGIEMLTRCIVCLDRTKNARMPAKDSGDTYAL